MEQKKKRNWFLMFIFIMFIIYLGLYFMDNLGYYNIAAKNKVITEEKLIEFESDVKNGNYIDIKDYIEDNTNYKNIYSNIGYNISIGIDNILNKGILKIGDVLKKLFK